MFILRYLDPENEQLRVQVGNCYFYPHREFAEQKEDGSYIRPWAFFFEHRLRLLQRDFELKNIPDTMQVRYVGKGDHVEQVGINGTMFPYNEWVTVPVDFNSINQRGQDVFLTLGFKMRFREGVRESLDDCSDGDKILVLRQYGGLGDIIMQSMIFTELREKFPTSQIDFALPKTFHSLFRGCEHYIDNILDSDKVKHKIYRLLAKGTYNFIGDISITCAKYECYSMDKFGFVDKERSDIWAESIGFKLKKHQSCINFSHGERTEAMDYLKPDGRPIVGFAPFSANLDRSYPYSLQQELVNGLSAIGCRVIGLHSGNMNVKCEQISTDIRKLGALISQMDLMVSVDTGQLHYAGVLGIPVIGLFGVTDSKVRLRYYNATAFQGNCKEGLPCWGRKSSSCKSEYSHGKSGMHTVKIANDMASCMFIDTKEIIRKAKEILSGSSHKAVEDPVDSHGRRTELPL